MKLKAKIILLGASALALGGAGTALACHQAYAEPTAIVLNAEGEADSEAAPAETSGEAAPASSETSKAEEVVDEAKEWVEKFFSADKVAMYISWIAYIGTIVGLAANIKKLHQSNNLTLKNVSDELKAALEKTIGDKVAEKFDAILPKMQATQEKTNDIMSIFSKILALSQENTPESKVAILNLIEELGTVSKETVDNAKDVVIAAKETAEEAKKAIDDKMDEIIEAYDGTSI